MHRLEEKLRKRLTGERYGSLETLFKGQGVAVSDSRRYQPGDQKATINRKQTAKRDQLYVNEYEAERTATVDLFLDINANRATGVNATNRSLARDFLADYMVFAIEYGLITTGYLSKHNDIFPKRLWWERDFMERYNDIERDVMTTSKDSYSSSLSIFLQYEKTLTKRRVVIIVADFLALSTSDQAILQWLNQRWIVICVSISSCLLIWKWYSFLTSNEDKSKVDGIALI